MTDDDYNDDDDNDDDDDDDESDDGLIYVYLSIGSYSDCSWDEQIIGLRCTFPCVIPSSYVTI